MRSRHCVDPGRLPRLTRIALMGQQPDEAFAFGGVHAEAALDCDFGVTVTVDVIGRQVDHGGDVFDHQVRLPGGILVPGETRHLLRHTNHVGSAVVIHVHNDDSVAAGDVGLDNVIFKVNDLLSGGQTSNGDKKQQGSVHNCAYHTAGCW